jgi:hypothetical protein
MGIKNLSSDVRGFLYGLCEEASMAFSEASVEEKPGLRRAVIPPRGSLAAAFQSVSWAARRGSLEDVNEALDTLVAKVNAVTDPAAQDQLEDARLQQQLFYRGQVRRDKQLEDDLGTFAKGIF